MDITKKLSDILRINLPEEYTSISYAMMIDGKIVAADALGHDGTKEKNPATINHTYNVCSISKIFCTTAVMQLVEQGKVDLDEPVCTYLPAFTMLDERYRQITVRHCLNHSSGLPGTQWKAFSATHVGTADNEEYYQAVYDFLAKSHLKADPGRYSVYCNDGFTLAEMVVAKVSGMPFGEYCKQNITEPIEAHSTRTSTTINPDYPGIRENKKPREFFYLQGCGGFTTNMIDLCKFGNLFLTKNDVISEESKAEMGKMQGKTFMKEDTSAILYGLGWDNVEFCHPEYDLGEHVQTKGGYSFQFGSKLFVIPKYNAVLAISQTHDCNLDVASDVLKMFALYMQEEKGISIYKKYRVIPQELIDQFDGTYLQPCQILNTHFCGTDLTITYNSTQGKHPIAYKDLKFDGENFLSKEGEKYFFRELPEGKFMFGTFWGKVSPYLMKAEDHEEVSAAWEKRIDKRYIVIDQNEQDMVSTEVMTGFDIKRLPGIKGVLLASFPSVSEEDDYRRFDCSFIPEDDMTGRGFLLTPSNGSRDLIDPYFEVKDGVEYCSVGSYFYKEEAALEDYADQSFADVPQSQYNTVYRLTKELEKLPEVPEGRRLMVLNDQMEPVYDSQREMEYKKQKKGYLCFI